MPKWNESDEQIVRQIVESGEKLIGGQVTLATSADQRASVLGGIFTAAGTAALGGLIAATATGSVTPGIVIGALFSGTLFLIGAGMCISTALPADFYMPGTRPENWYDDIADKKTLLESFGEYAEDCQTKIDKNNAVLEFNARRFKRGAYLGIGAPFVGMILWFLLTYVRF